MAKRKHEDEGVDVSVLVPCKNAMPWLPMAVRDPLLQVGLRVEVVVVDDWSDDGSSEWLDALADELGPRGTVERAASSNARRLPNLATAIDRRTSDAVPSFGPGAQGSLSVPAADIVAPGACARAVLSSPAQSRLRVLSNAGHGQGAALQTALDAARGSLVAHMEADDEYGAERLVTLRRTLLGHADVQAVFSPICLFGPNVTDGMSRYVQWQNSLLTPEDMDRARFLEMPALHQTGLYRRESLDACAQATPGSSPAAQQVVYRDMPQWPVDYDFLMRWFDAGNRAMKIAVDSADGNKTVYRWRQHHSNGTRWQGRCDIDALRACKIHYLTSGERSPLKGQSTVHVYSVGRTLDAWTGDLAAVGGVTVAASHQWNPRKNTPDFATFGEVEGPRPFRLFAYGHDKVRSRVLALLGGDWDPEKDWFVA